MACNSVAVTSASITVKLTQAELIDLMTKIAGDIAQEIVTYDNYEFMSKTRRPEDTITVAVAKIGKYRAIIQQSVTPAGKVSQVFTIDNGSTVDGEDKLRPLVETLTPKFNKALPVANQTAVLKRLSALGKLSNIQQKDNGVVATVKLSI